MNAIKAIRKNVFCVTQQEFATIANVTQSSVSRWESGIAPTLEEMANIRNAALSRGLVWDDRWFFEAPLVPDKAEMSKAEPTGAAA